jgi:hypothetical protein
MPKNIELFCEPTSFNWFVLPELQTRLSKMGLEVKRQKITIRRYPTTIEYDSIEEALTDVRVNGQPKRFELRYSSGDVSKSFGLQRFITLDDDDLLKLNLDGLGSVEDVRSLADFLGLKVDTVTPKKPTLEKKCFIAHRFDERGEELAEKLARFLSLLNFDVLTGRGFVPGSVSEKVKSRMSQQALVFAILTSGEDNTWLIQESLLGSLEKPLFLLKETQYSFKPGLLGDHEYIPFTAPNLETTFIPILEGIKNLGFKS